MGCTNASNYLLAHAHCVVLPCPHPDLGDTQVTFSSVFFFCLLLSSVVKLGPMRGSKTLLTVLSYCVHLLAGGEAGPSNIEESRSESRKKSKAGGVPSRPLPVTVCKQVISKLAKDEKWQGWAFDGRKNIYTAKAFMDVNQEHNFKVGLLHVCVFCSLTVGTSQIF